MARGRQLEGQQAHQIYTRYRRTVADLNAPTNISIVQRVWKCQRNEWISTADFRPITTRRYKNKKRYLRGYCTKFTKFLRDVAASSLVLMPLCRWRYCILLLNARAKTEGGQI